MFLLALGSSPDVGSSRNNISGSLTIESARGKSILLTTHYLEEAELLADRVAIMNKGKIIDSGLH